MSLLHVYSRRLAMLAIGLFVVSGLSSSLFAQALQQYDRKAPPSEEDVFMGRVWVKFKPGVSVTVGGAKTGLPHFDYAAAAFDVHTVDTAFPILDHYLADSRFADATVGLRRVYEVRYDGPYNPVHVAEALAEDPAVEYAEPIPIDKWQDAAPSGMATPNDSLFSEQGYLKRLKLPEAWNHMKGSMSSAVIAINDGGTMWRHEDLVGDNVWENTDEIADNGIDDDDNGFIDDTMGWNFQWDKNDPTGDPNTALSASHGTWTASVAAGTANNSEGLTGASWNGTYMPINVSCKFFSSVCYAVEGIMYAAANGADVVNVSYGSFFYSATTEAVYQAAHDMGTLTVAAAGNGGTNNDIDPFYPASYPFTLAVGGTLNDTDMNRFNYGQSVDVYAAGVLIWGAATDGSYQQVSGTSFSAPQAAAVATLVKGAFPNSNADQLRERIRFTADNIDAENHAIHNGQLGKGRVNAFRAVTEDGYPAIRVVSSDVSDTENDEEYHRGDTGTLKAAFVNFLSPSPVTFRAESSSDAVVFDTPEVSFGTLGTLDSAMVEFSFTVAEEAPYRTEVTLSLHVDTGGSSEQAFSAEIEVNPAGFLSHNSGAMLASITTEGNLGFIDYSNNSDGVGIKFLNRRGFSTQVIYQGGLMVARSAKRVSDAVGISGRQDLDLLPTDDASLVIEKPGTMAGEDGMMTLSDMGARKPMDIEIKQESFVNSGAEHEDYMILRYTFMNTGDRKIEDLHAALFFDWDIGFFLVNRTYYDAARRLGYQTNVAIDPELVAGTKVLSHSMPVHFHTDYVSPLFSYGFNDRLKWDMMTGGIVSEWPQTSSDYFQIVGVGPMEIEPGGEATVGFALVGGVSVADFRANADNAQKLWDTEYDPSTAVQFVQNNANLWLDVYVDGEKAVEDMQSHSAVPYLHFKPGMREVSVAPFWTTSAAFTLASVSLPLDAGASTQLFVHGDDGNVSLHAVLDPAWDGSDPELVDFYPVHAANDVGMIDLRLVDPMNDNEIIGYLENDMKPGEFAEVHSLIPAQYNLEISTADENERLEVFRFDTHDWAGQTFTLTIAGNGMSSNEGLTMMLVQATGETMFPNVFTATESAEELPEAFVLDGNYPNPFNPTTTIQFDLPASAKVTVHIADVLGRTVMTVPGRDMAAGSNQRINVDASELASGTYFYRVLAEMETETAIQTGSMMLVK